MDKVDGCVGCYNISFTMDMIPTTITLALINLVTLGGNSLVIAAVITTRKLRTTTNTYIVSLACSDILLGIFVIPFSASLEILNYWPFGSIWCTMWLTIDVLLCTASILNLCAISFDRYLAVTRPMQYSNAMSRRRSKVLVATVWILSILICIPPLLGWNDKTSGESKTAFNNSNEVLNISSLYSVTSACNSTPPQCELTSSQGYRIYSALGSFYIPMFLMVFFYCKIYKAAVRTASAMRSGILKQNKDAKRDNEPIIMRVHRGNYVLSRNSQSMRCIQRSASLRNSMRNCSEINSRNRHCIFSDTKSEDVYPQNEAKSVDVEAVNFMYVNNTDVKRGYDENKKHDSPFTVRKQPTPFTLRVKRLSVDSTNTLSSACRSNYKLHISKMLKETKATKTVAIIVGVFIMCWFPFFTMYLIEAFWGTRVPALAFSVMFWLGYCNSMLNPFIYGMFSRDFRSAFRRICLRCCPKCAKCKFANRRTDLRMKRRHFRYPVGDFDRSSES